MMRSLINDDRYFGFEAFVYFRFIKKLIMRISIILLSLFFTFGLYAQQTPAPAQKGSILILGATAHLGNGKVIETSAIAFENGKLTLVADSKTIKIDRNSYSQVIDAVGKHVYPGFIASNTQIGLKEIDAVRATADNREVGYLNPNIRAIIAYNTDSRVTPTIRSNGVMMAQIVPQGGAMPGQSSVVQLDAWNWEDAGIKVDDGIHLNWPSTYRRTGWWAEPGPIKPNDKYGERTDRIKEFFKEAKAYTEGKAAKKNLKFEAMRGVLDKSKKLYIHTGQAKAMMDVVDFKRTHELDVVIVGGRDAWLIPDLLKKNNIPVILSAVQALPSRADDDVDLPFRIPSLLHKAGVDFCLSYGGAWEQRNLVFQAGQAVSYGLPYEEAIRALTSSSAKILGLENVGVLENGKDATLFISKGDVLDMRTSVLEHAFIQGRAIDLDNKQKALYRKFKEKYEQN